MIKGEFIQSLGYARGSLLELQTQLEIALDLAYLSSAEFDETEALGGEVRALLNRLIESLQTKSKGAGA